MASLALGDYIWLLGVLFLVWIIEVHFSDVDVLAFADIFGYACGSAITWLDFRFDIPDLLV